MRSRLAAVIGSVACALILAVPAYAAFPGANGKIAFASFRDGNWEIYTMNADGTNQTRLTYNAAPPETAADWTPAWSPDGTRIAFMTARDGGYPYQIYTMNADGSNQTPLTNTNTITNEEPAWSPDGTEIAFAALSFGGDGYRIYTMNADGTNRTRLTNGPFHDRGPAWSPDATKIAFATGGDVGSYEIYTINADGTYQTRLTNNSVDDVEPAWSPDGSKIAFAASSTGGYPYQIYTMNADGTHRTRLTNNTRSDDEPAWSPDGTKIAFHRVGDFYDEIYTMNADGTNQTRLTNTPPASNISPDWQPIPNRPPHCSGVAASRPVLTTANHRLVAITLDGATDPDGDSVTLSVDGVTQDEPVTGAGDHTSPDAVAEGEGELRVRAERNQHGDGRVYRIAFTASDGRGGSCSGTTTVSVPRKRHKPAIDSAPPSYDSLAR